MIVPQKLALARPFTHDSGNAFRAGLSEGVEERLKRGAEAYLTENGARLPWPNTAHQDIRDLGGGRYILWKGYAYFSASDSSNCQENGRSYELVMLDWPRWYEQADQDAASAEPQPLTRTLVNTYATRHAASPRLPFISEVRAFSMLHEETLLLMHYFASR